MIRDELLKVYAARNPARMSIDLWLFERGGGANKIANVSATLADVDAIHDPVPSLTISYDAAQKLMDALWEAGIKPSGGEGHTAHIRALNAHLDDMRRLVFERENGRTSKS